MMLMTLPLLGLFLFCIKQKNVYCSNNKSPANSKSLLAGSHAAVKQTDVILNKSPFFYDAFIKK